MDFSGVTFQLFTAEQEAELADYFAKNSSTRPNDFTPTNPSVLNTVNVAITPPIPTVGNLQPTIEYAQAIAAASVAEFGVQETPIVVTLLETLDDAGDLAGYLVRPVPAFWFGNIQIIMNGLTDTQRTIIGNLDIGSQVSVTKTFPNPSTPSTVTQIMALEGISHDITPDRHIVTLYTNPARIYTYFIVGGYTTTTTRTNLLQNPNLETDATYWLPSGTGSTIARSTTQAYLGSASLLWSYPSTLSNPLVVAQQGAGSFRVSVTAGQSYTYSVYVFTDVPDDYRCDIRWATAITGGSVVDTTGTASTITANTWTRYSVTGTAPVGYPFAQLHIYRVTNTVTGTTYLDAGLFEQTSSVLPYFDGTYANTYPSYTLTKQAWNGTANASTSTTTWGLTSSFVGSELDDDTKGLA